MANIRRGRWLIVGGIVVLAIVLGAFAKRKQPTPYFTARVERGDIRQEVQATGTINAVITVQVGSQVSGIISELDADFNSKVKKGQILARLDPALFRGALLQAQADLANSRANAGVARANYDKAVATMTQAEAQYRRSQALAEAKVVAQQQLESDRAAAQSAEAEVASAKAAIGQADAQVQQKAAAVSVAQTNLNNTIIRSPIDGTVVNRSVDVGQTVAASLQAPTLFTVAQDLTKMQVDTQTDESDVGMIQVGQAASFKVDAFPKDTFLGHIAQIRMNATVVQNVVTYDTIVDFDNPGQKLFPGMTAYVNIPVAIAQNTLEVPDAALRYKPDMKPDELRAFLQQHGIDPNSLGQRTAAAAGPARKAMTPGTPQRKAGTSAQAQNRAVVWKKSADGKTLAPVLIQTGITDHAFTQVLQVLKGNLAENDQLITGAAAVARNSGPAQPGASLHH